MNLNDILKKIEKCFVEEDLHFLVLSTEKAVAKLPKADRDVLHKAFIERQRRVREKDF